jgi:cytochrome c biogenesis protein CcdA
MSQARRARALPAVLIFAVLDNHLWGSFAMMAVFGLGAGITFGAIAGMIVRSVPETQTGSAMGFY